MKAVVVFAHGSGSSRFSPRNKMMAQFLNRAGYGTFLFDLLTVQEAENRQNVFNMSLLGERLVLATRQLKERDDLEKIPIAFFGASTGGGAALIAASQLGKNEKPYAIVSRGGRPDLARDILEKVDIPTLLVVGEWDPVVMEFNQEAWQKLPRAELVVIPRATHLFEEAGALEQVAQEAELWLDQNLSEEKESRRPSKGVSARQGKELHHRT